MKKHTIHYFIFNNLKFYKILILLSIIPLNLFPQINFTSSNIPIIIIETSGQEIIDDTRIISHMGIIDNGEGEINYITDPYNGYNGNISIEIRGSTSQMFDKKQYGLETQTVSGDNNNVSLLGLPAENDWILYGPYSDKTLIRNILAYKLSESLGHYAPRTRLCELVLNEEYMGVYVLMEKIKRDKNRVDIAKLTSDENNGDDLTGGYIIKFDKQTGTNCDTIVTEFANIHTYIEYPKCDNITPTQKSYIHNYINSFEESLYSNHFSDSIIGYRPFIDVNSFIDYFFINEISRNIDAYNLSSFMYKDKDSKNGKLSFGPVWDYNIAFGNVNYNNGYKISGLNAPNHIWYQRLLQDTTFTNILNERWIQVRNNQLSNDNIINIIDSLVFILNEPQKRNFEKWDIISSQIWPNYHVAASYEGEISFLKSWIIARLNWLDNNLPNNTNYTTDLIDYQSKIFPNPFDYFFTFTFTLEERSNVSLYLMNLHGEKIIDIVNTSYYEEGEHRLVWEYDRGDDFPNGFYIIVLEINHEIVLIEKLVNK